MSTFPSITSLEPPPLDSTSEDEDSFEFRTPGLKLDLQSADPSPISTPRKSAKSTSSSSLPKSISEENGHRDSPDGGGVNQWDTENVDIEEDEDFKDCFDEDSVTETKQDQLSTPTTEQVPSNNSLSQLEAEEKEVPPVSGEELPINHGVEDKVQEPETTSSAEEDGFQSSSLVVDDLLRDGEAPDKDSQEDFIASDKVERMVEDSCPSDSAGQEETFQPDEDDFGNFAVFQTPDSVADGDGDIPSTPVQDNQEFEDDDDDFGDFSSNSFQQSAAPVPGPVVQTGPVLLDPGGNDEEAEDDFDDFANFQSLPSTSSQFTGFHQSSTSSITSPRSSADFTAALESKFDTLIKAVIPPLLSSISVSEEAQNSSPEPGTNSPPETEESPTCCNLTLIEKELSETKDCCWGHTLDFEDSRALLHKWPQSSSQQRFYQSLKIDTSTIVYTEKWGAIEVPRCAAGMVEKPILLPQVVSSSRSDDSPQPERRTSSSQEDNPVISNGKPQQQLSLEAQRIIQKIPDISYMTSKTLVFPQSASSSSRSNSLL